MSPATLSLVAFVVTVAVFGGSALFLSRRQNRGIQNRLAALSGGGAGTTTAPSARGGSVLSEDDIDSGLKGLLVRLGTRTPKEVEREKAPAKDADDRQPALRKKTEGIQDTLVQAGFRRQNAFALFMGARIALGLLVLSVGLLAAAVIDPALMGGAFCFALFGYVLPGFVVARMATQRKQYIRQTLPDTLDLLLLCVEAGLGLNAAMQRVAEERTSNGADPIGEELLQLSKELQVGLTRRDALRNLAERTGSDDVRALCASLIQSERLGSSIAQTLRAQSDSIRTQRKLEAEELANKVQIKLLFPLILFIFPTVMIVILLPAGIRLMAALGTLM